MTPFHGDELNDLSPFEADPWDSTEKVSMGDPAPDPTHDSEPEPADPEDPWEGAGPWDGPDPWGEPDGEGPDAVVGSDPEEPPTKETPAVAPRRSVAQRPIALIRAHSLAAIVAVCFVAAALLMLSIRPSGPTRSHRPAGTDHPSHRRARGVRPR